MEQHSDSLAAEPAPPAASPETCPEPGRGGDPGPPHPLPTTDQDDDEGVITPPEVYDPAEYRWVPVRRQPRSDGWTEEKMRRFIETLADTGQVGLAAKAVGLSRESAYKLRRSPHGEAFARAWDAARHQAGAFLEDVAFERAIEGVEHNVYNEYGDVVCTKRVVSDRLLMFLLRHLKPERYAADALARPEPPPEPVEIALKAMEPQLPAPAEKLLGLEQLGHELLIAEIADGKLPHFYSEQRPPKTAARLAAEARAEQQKRGEAAWKKLDENGGKVSDAEFKDICRYLDPVGAARSRKRYR